MPDSSVDRVLHDPLRPARVFRQFFVAIAIGFLLAAVVVGVTAGSAERVVVASADGPSLQLPDTARSDLTLYGLGPGGGRPSNQGGCTLDGGTRGIFDPPPLEEFQTGGSTLVIVGEVPRGWDPDATVDCPGVTRLVAVEGGGPGPRLAVAGALLIGALISTVIAVAGMRSQRARAQRSRTS